MTYTIEVCAAKKFVVDARNEIEARAVAVEFYNGTPARCLDLTADVIAVGREVKNAVSRP